MSDIELLENDTITELLKEDLKADLIKKEAIEKEIEYLAPQLDKLISVGITNGIVYESKNNLLTKAKTDLMSINNSITAKQKATVQDYKANINAINDALKQVNTIAIDDKVKAELIKLNLASDDFAAIVKAEKQIRSKIMYEEKLQANLEKAGYKAIDGKLMNQTEQLVALKNFKIEKAQEEMKNYYLGKNKYWLIKPYSIC